MERLRHYLLISFPLEATNRTGVGVIPASAMGFISSDVGASTSFFMGRKKDPFDDDDELFRRLEEQETKKREAAIKAIEFFIGKYVPATNDTADVFFSTSDIQNAISVHTGGLLSASEIYETMINMGYSFDARNGLDFFWLLRKA